LHGVDQQRSNDDSRPHTRSTCVSLSQREAFLYRTPQTSDAGAAERAIRASSPHSGTGLPGDERGISALAPDERHRGKPLANTDIQHPRTPYSAASAPRNGRSYKVVQLAGVVRGPVGAGGHSDRP